MTPEELKQLEIEHKKAMEGIEAMNKALRSTIDAYKHNIGIDNPKKGH